MQNRIVTTEVPVTKKCYRLNLTRPEIDKAIREYVLTQLPAFPTADMSAIREAVSRASTDFLNSSGRSSQLITGAVLEFTE